MALDCPLSCYCLTVTPNALSDRLKLRRVRTQRLQSKKPIMECKLCGHAKTYKHGKMPNGHQRYFCLQCKQTFSESFNTFYYYRRISPQQIQQVLQAHGEGTSLRGISRISGLAYNTVVSIVRSLERTENDNNVSER